MTLCFWMAYLRFDLGQGLMRVFSRSLKIVAAQSVRERQGWVESS